VVGSFPANPFGLYDVLGNVGEWTSSEYRISYDREENRAATVASDEGDRSVRGGWCYLEQGCVRTAFRIGLRVDSRVSYVGFRLLREV
jgi:formylglycine-generating enzyme required for sulfatase activity